MQDLEDQADDEIAELKIRMENACTADNTARENGEPAINKLKMLPEVVGVLNRNTIRHTIVDPETNFLQSVKFFLEPLNDGSLPAYNIQRDLFHALETLPIDKETLLASGIGKVVLYYTKSKRPEIGIKRIAERLLADWSRPILKRSDDYKKRKIATAEYDARYLLYSPLVSDLVLTFSVASAIWLFALLDPNPSTTTTSPSCPSVTLSASAFWPSQSSVTVLDLRHTLLRILWRRDRISMSRRGSRILSRLGRRVWSSSGG